MKLSDKQLDALQNKPFSVAFKATLGYYMAQLVVTSILGLIVAAVFYSLTH